MRSFSAMMAVIAFALPLFGGYATSDAWIPIAGHATGYAGRHFETTLYLTDTSRSMNDVTVSFYPAGQSTASPRGIHLQLGPNQSAVIDVGSQLAGGSNGIGALHIRSTGPLAADAHLYSHIENQPRTSNIGEAVNAIPAQYAIGAGDSTLVHVPAGARYKLYAVETTGYALYFSVSSGATERRLMIEPHEQASWDLASILPGAEVTRLNVTGINGSGRIIIVGTAVANESQDFTVYEMLLPSRARHRLMWPEMSMYAAVAIAIAASALYRMKRGG